ncbi:exopolysaccharide biosynthesis protein [Tropicimonas aquimaris]|uniref:Exopolysaccharide biosynthesis protein n=1 Tax=Tropicimonas aquimaris TaxID=914152 RepID=A0ABW3IMW3_9RHOB
MQGCITGNETDAERPVRSIVEKLSDFADEECVSIGDIADAFGAQSFLPMVMIPAILVVTPLSGIPLFSSACGLTIAIVAAQMLFGRNHLWLPGFLMRREINGEKAQGAMKWVHRMADWLDSHSRKRLSPLTRWPMRKWIQALCLVCGLCMPLLEVVPFSSSILGAAVLLLSTSLMTRDGLFALLGIVAMGGALVLPLTALGMF